VGTTVEATDEPGHVLERAGSFLAGDPVRHNVILSLLHTRVANAEPGRYWSACRGGEVVGVAFQSPLSFPATVTPMDSGAVEAVVERVIADGVDLPGVGGEAATAARFAGQWAERRGSAATPVQGQRIYEVDAVQAPPPVGGFIRPAAPVDRERLIGWMHAFHVDIGEALADPEAAVDRAVAAGRFWVWDDDGPVSMAARTVPVAGVARVQAVYTPPERRGAGYASSCVAAVSAAARAAGLRCILYTDLANPTSNSVYRRIGYRAVAEGLRYRFA
jgi:uncharacterized protein